MTSYPANGSASADAASLTLANGLSFVLPLIVGLGGVATAKTVSLTSGQNSGSARPH